MAAAFIRIAATLFALSFTSSSAFAVTAVYVDRTLYGDDGIPAQIRGWGNARDGIHVAVESAERRIQIDLSAQSTPLPDVFICTHLGDEPCAPSPSGPLAPGYSASFAEKFGENSGWHGGLNVSVDGRECDEVRGAFYIDELTFSGSGEVQSVSFTLTQRCFGSPDVVFISGAVNAATIFKPYPVCCLPSEEHDGALFGRQDYFVPRGEGVRSVAILAVPYGDMALPPDVRIYIGENSQVDVPLGGDRIARVDHLSVDSAKSAVSLGAFAWPMTFMYRFAGAVAHIFDPGEVVFDVPTKIDVQVGTEFDLVAALSIRQIFASGVPVTIDAPVTGPGLAAVPQASTADRRGRVNWRLRANDAPGAYVVTLRYGGARFDVDVVNHVEPVTPIRDSVLSSPAGQVRLGVTQAQSAGCMLLGAGFTPQPEGLVGVVLPYPATTMSVSKCGVGAPVTFSIDYPAELPPTATYWKFGPTPGHAQPHWYPLPSRVEGNRITFTIVDGGVGDDDLMANGSILQTGAVAFAGGPYQDLWWSGPAENGWGMSVVQHRDALFANIYAYDAQGEPTWYVMPSGAWNEARTTFTGPIYLPKGSAYFAYDPSRFDIGAALGTASITFYAMNDAVLEYTIAGVSGRKIISRVGFGSPAEEVSRNVSDLWWGGAGESGWGIAIMQQHSAVFAVWFTYDAAGAPRWFVMPGGGWNGADNLQGAIYRATGSPWLGETYDATQHRMNEVGNYRFHFSGDAASFDYSIAGSPIVTLPLSRIPF